MRLTAFGIAVFCAFAPLSASALPGQSIEQFNAWSAQRPLLRGLQRTTDEMSGWPSFTLLTADHGIAWRFSAHTDRRSIVSEMLAVSTTGGDPGSEPIRQRGNGYGMTFLRSLYGAAVAGDYRGAARVASFSDATTKAVTVYYRGLRYGYVTSGGSLSLETFAAFNADLAQMRRCSAHPERCSE
jgi:hypothetical protein